MTRASLCTIHGTLPYHPQSQIEVVGNW